MIRQAKKVRRQRGSRTHGWGAGKKHRGKGSRGGVGNSGIGKRGAHKKSKWLALNNKVPTGKHGMRNYPHQSKIDTINLCQIEAKLDFWIANKQITKEKDIYIIDLKSLGFDKLLGTGKLANKLRIKVAAFSASAAEKVKEAGGEIVQ